MIKSLLVIVFIPMLAIAQESTVGMAFYSIQNKTFPCEKALKVYDGVKKPALMFLWSTFGDNLNCVRKFIELPQKKKEIYIHISNECCRRNRTCKNGELLKEHSVAGLNNLIELRNKKVKKAYQDRLNKIIKFIENYKNENITWYISTGLEDNYSFNAKKIVYNWLQNGKNKSELKDNIRIYVNPLNKNCVNTKCEIHDKNAGINNHWAYVPDGYCVKPFDACKNNIMTQEEVTVKLLKQKKNKNKFFLWWSEQQGRYGEPPSLAKPPRKRIIKIKDNQIKDANDILKKGN